MLGSHATLKFERSFHKDHDAAAEEPLATYFEAAGGAFSPNTERALRADVQAFEVVVPTASSARRSRPARTRWPPSSTT